MNPVKRVLEVVVDVIMILLSVNAVVILVGWTARALSGAGIVPGFGGGMAALYALSLGLYVWLLPLSVALLLVFWLVASYEQPNGES